MKARAWLSLLIVAIGAALGALREFIFVNLNFHLDYLLNQRDRNYAHSVFRKWAGALDADQASALKWALALLFVATMALLTALLCRVRFGDHRYRKAVIVAFAGLGACALLCHLLGAWLPHARPVSVAMLHALQYPVPLLLVWAMSLLQPAGER
ncbi:MAG: hypothetical protein WAT74_03075 [Flavobacteriales bacterium]